MGLMESLFGDHCGRCQERSTDRVDGLCATCRAELKARTEQVRHCPVDGEAMRKQVRLNIVVDVCPTCRGIWLDGGELEVVQRGFVHTAVNEPYGFGLLHPGTV